MSEETEQKTAFRHIVLRPRMMEMGEWKTTRRRVGTKKVVKTMGVFNKKEIEVDEPIYETERQWMPSGKVSDVQVDIENFGEMIEQACNELHDAGYEVFSITPVIRGNYQYKENPGKIQKGSGYIGHAFGFGYSVTDGVVVLGKLIR